MNVDQTSVPSVNDEVESSPDKKKRTSINIIKVRDDHSPLQFIVDENDATM